MNIIVCIKQVPDPEGPMDSFVINPETNRVEPKGIPPVLSLFDENALEVALRIKDRDKDNVKVTVLSIGKRISNAVMIKALAAGADTLLKVEDEVFDAVNIDSHVMASALASAIKKSGDYDLIFTGRQAADWNAGQVGIGIAAILGIPAITLAKNVEVEGREVFVERVLSSGYEKVKASLPVVMMASNEVGELRYPTVIQRRDAKNKPITAWSVSDIDLNKDFESKVFLKKLYKPKMREGKCELIQGASLADAGKALAQKLKEDHII